MVDLKQSFYCECGETLSITLYDALCLKTKPDPNAGLSKEQINALLAEVGLDLNKLVNEEKCLPGEKRYVSEDDI
jgi:hypothetical protein